MNNLNSFAKEDIERWMNKEVGSTFYDFALDNNMRSDLDKLLKDGLIGNRVLHSSYCSKDNPRIEVERRYSMAYLLINDRDTFNYLKENNINLFHGSNANALPGISKHGLLSVNKIKENNEKVNSGEKWSRVGGKRNFISLTDDLEIAWSYMQMDDGCFPLIVGVTDEKFKEKNINTCHVCSDLSEVGVLDELPLEAIDCVIVPREQIAYTKAFLANTNVAVLGLSNINTKYFWFDDFSGCKFILEKYAEYKEKRFKEKKAESKITANDLKVNAFSRFKNKMQEMSNWIANLANEREDIKDDSKRL